jgi:hypothetical protein
MANSLIVLPEGPARYESGDQVNIQVLHWDSVLRENCDGLDASGRD